MKSLKEFMESTKTPFQHGYNAWKDHLTGKNKQRPKDPYQAGKGMHEYEQGAARASDDLGISWD